MACRAGSADKWFEQMGGNAASSLIQDWRSGGCVDRYGQDQIIVLMALAAGEQPHITACRLLVLEWPAPNSRGFCSEWVIGDSAVRTGPLELHTETAIHFAQVKSCLTHKCEVRLCS